MKATLQITVLTILIGFFSIQSMVAYAEQPKGSRLNIKPAVKKKALTFKKGKSVLAFKPVSNNFDLQRSKTVNLYFNSYLINSNLSKPVVKETIFTSKVAPSNTDKAELKETEEEIAVEQGDRFYTAEGLIVSNIFPNPADDAAFFDYSASNSTIKDLKIQFFNVLGSPMNVSIYLDKLEKRARVTLKDFPNGFYFYQLTGDGKTLATKKLLVRHSN